MAAQYDALGNYLGDWETEEERKKREEEYANTPVATQEIKTYGDGTVERTTTEEYAPAIQPVRVQPVQRTPVYQPVAPVAPETYGRMIQAESGGRDFTPQGQPVTSPKGAMFASQVMPATAAQPGFGIRPAQAQTPEEYNRVGQEYYGAMLQQFGGDERKAAAAYNAGPGRVQQAEAKAAQTGGSWTDYLPKETMGYLGKVFGSMIPSAQAGTLPPREAGAGRGFVNPPVAQPEQPVSPEQLAAQPAPQAQPQPAAQPVTNPLLAMQDDPIQMLAAVKDPATSEADKKWLGETLRDKYLMDINMTKAKEEAKTLATGAAMGDRKAANTIAKELQNQEGSWLKMILLGFISPQLAGEEAIKLGFGNKWVQGSDSEGNTAMIQVNAKGLPLKGYDKAGNEIAAESLVAYTTGGKRDLDIVGGTYINDKTGEVGRVVTDKKTGQSYIQTDKGRQPMAGFRPQSTQGSLADMRLRQIQELNVKLQGKTLEEKMAILRPYNQALVGQGLPAIDPSEVGITAPQIGGGGAATQAQPAGQAAGAVPPPTTTTAGGTETRQIPQKVAPPAATQPPGMGVGKRPTMSDIEAGKTKAKEEAEVTGKDIGTIRANQGKSEANADYLITKVDQLLTHPGFEVSVGSQLGPSMGFGLFKEPVRGTDAAGWFARFKEVQGQSFLQAIENLRGMGALSNLEGETATKAIQRMNVSMSEDEFKAAAKDFQEIIQRGIDRNRVKLGQEPKYGTKPASETAAETPTKKLSREDTQALEWARKNPKDPRADQIKKRLGL